MLPRRCLQLCPLFFKSPKFAPPFPLQNFCIQPCEITVIFQNSDGELKLNSSPSASMPCAPINVQTTLPLQYCPSQKIGQGSYERCLGDVRCGIHHARQPQLLSRSSGKEHLLLQPSTDRGRSHVPSLRVTGRGSWKWV